MAISLRSVNTDGTSIAQNSAWILLKSTVEEMRLLQTKDGSIPSETPGVERAPELLTGIINALTELAPHFSHDSAYIDALLTDLSRWGAGGFGVPDFLDSLMAFHPSRQRCDGLQHLILFPMYTQNGNPHRNLEALLVQVVWPEWLAELENRRYDNAMFVPITFIDFTSGYGTNAAVLFPETVAVREIPERFSWGAIFCDREAARFRMVTEAAARALGVELPPDAAELIADQTQAVRAYALWDLIHDRSHGHGELPFDPFMIKQRSPFWMYSLEELRCDLTAYREAVRLEAEGFVDGKAVQYAVLFDRLFRFPITGERVRNYDGLGGQLLFAYLHQRDVVRWEDNRLTIDWERVTQVTIELCDAIEKLYRDGIDRPKLAHWLAGYRLVSSYLTPHPGSQWAKGVDALPWELPPRKLVDTVLPDEFPLSMFYEALQKKLGAVIAATSGITGASAVAA